MLSFSFKNFRRFSQCTDFKLGGITLEVGPNNSGKSTLFKALEFFIENIKNLDFHYENTLTELEFGGKPCFKFDSNKYGNYGRIHRWGSNNPLEFTLIFGSCEYNTEYNDDNHRFEIKISFDNAEDSANYILINSIEIIDRELYLSFKIEKDSCIITWSDFENHYVDGQLLGLNKNITDIDSETLLARKTYLLNPNFGINDLEDGNIPGCEYRTLSQIRGERFTEASKLGKLVRYSAIRKQLPLAELKNYSTSLKITQILENLRNFSYLICREHTEDNDNSESANIIPIGIASRIEYSAIDLEESLNRIFFAHLKLHQLERVIVYQSNHPLHNQISRFISSGGRNGTIHTAPDNFGISKIIANSNEIVIECLKLFDIATDYRITDICGECYTFELKDKNTNNWVHLADYGTGTIRLVEIILFVINYMGNNSYLYIEEPEQNLHPKFQSLLADLFLLLNQRTGTKFIIETHSEYLIRRSQIIVAKNNYTEEELITKNPFKVYYFPENGNPYDMRFKNSGRFERNFGKGFFDEASESALTILRLEREREKWQNQN